MKRALLSIGAAFACAAAAYADPPSITVDRTTYRAIQTADIMSSSRAEKTVIDAIELMAQFNISNSKLDPDEIAFLELVFSEPAEILVKSTPAPDFTPRDIVWKNVWAPGRANLDSAMDVLRARTSERVTHQSKADELAGRFPVVEVSLPLLSALIEVRDRSGGLSPVSAVQAQALVYALHAERDPQLISMLLNGPYIFVAASGERRAAIRNVWSAGAKSILSELSPDIALAQLWTGKPDDVAKLAAIHARSPADAEATVAFLAKQLEPVAAESKPAEAYAPMRSFVARAVVIINQLPAAERPGARQLLHDAVDRASKTQTPPLPALFARLSLTLMADQE